MIDDKATTDQRLVVQGFETVDDATAAGRVGGTDHNELDQLGASNVESDNRGEDENEDEEPFESEDACQAVEFGLEPCRATAEVTIYPAYTAIGDTEGFGKPTYITSDDDALGRLCVNCAVERFSFNWAAPTGESRTVSPNCATG